MYTITVTSERYSEPKVVESDVFLNNKLFDPVLTAEKNRAGSFTFSVYDNHELYKDFVLFQDRIHISVDNITIFSGRGIQEKYDFNNKRSITCEGALAFLSDVIVPYSASYEDPKEYINYLISFYNNSKNRDKNRTERNRFTVTGFPSDSLKNVKDLTKDGERYKTVFDLLTEVLNHCGWTVLVDYSDWRNDHYRLRFVDTPVTTHSIPVEFANNLKDLSKDHDMAEFATVFYPLGKPKNASSESVDDHRGVSLTADKTFVPREYISQYGTIVKQTGRANDKLLQITEIPDGVESVIITASARTPNCIYTITDSSGEPLLYELASDHVPIVIEDMEETATLTDVEVELPDGASAIYASWYDEQNGFYPQVWSYLSTAPDHKGVSLTSMMEPTPWMYIDSHGYVRQEDENCANNKVVAIGSTDLKDVSKVIITTKSRYGYGLYAFTDSFGHLLLSSMADDSAVFTILTDEVVSVPEGAKNLYIGFYGIQNEAEVWVYKSPEIEENMAHLGDDLMITQAPDLKMIFGHIDGESGQIIDYTQTAVVGAKTDSIVYSGIKVEENKKYVYSGINREGHGMIRVVGGITGTEIYYLKNAGSGEVLTNLQYTEFTVPPGGTICDIGGLLGDARTHLWVYDEDKTKDNYVTIESVNNGYPYLWDDTLIEKYGWIERVETFDDIDSPQSLLDKAKEFLAKKRRNLYEYTINALDPSVTNGGLPYLPFDKVKVVSSPHDVDVEMIVKRSEIHLDSPQSSSYEFENEEE